ncbi:MAG: TetR/AcrR family transcriptional regulator [Eggerthellaceae bacterium]
MADALLFLMREKPFAKITADEICLRAGVGRATWFRQFSSKEAALAYKMQVLWLRWLESNGIHISHGLLLEDPCIFFRFFYENRLVFEALYSAGMRHVVIDCFQEVLIGQIEPFGKTDYADRFVVFGLVGVVDLWISGGFRESLSQMDELARGSFDLSA